MSDTKTKAAPDANSREDLPGSRLAWFTRLYLPTIAKGMMITMRHFFMKPVTIQYPEQKAKISERFRGEHRLTKDAEGNMKCVACYMCATACPAQCIHIEAQAAPPEWENRDKIPEGVRNRHAEVHLLRFLRGGLPQGGHRDDE